MNNQPETWKRERSEEVADARVFKVRRDFSARESDNLEHTFFVIENPDWVNVVALTKENEVILIQQYRHGAEEIVLEIPGGMVDNNERAEVCAARELLEETGYAPREMISLGKSRPNPAIQNNWIYHFLALDCDKIKDTAFDEHENIVTKLVSLKEIEQLIESGEITHSLVLAAFYKFMLKSSNQL